MKGSLREFRWVGALLWRCLAYGARMAVDFLGFSLLLGLMLAMLAVPLGMVLGAIAAMAHWGDALIVIQFLFIAAVGIALLNLAGSLLVGGVSGLATGFYSPPQDGEKKFYSFVLNSGQSGLLYGLLAGLVGGAAVEILVDWLWSFCYGAVAVSVAVLVALIGQVYGLWRGINAGLVEMRSDEKAG